MKIIETNIVDCLNFIDSQEGKLKFPNRFRVDFDGFKDLKDFKSFRSKSYNFSASELEKFESTNEIFQSSVCGFMPNIDGFLTGSPLSMFNTETVVSDVKILDINIYLSVPYMTKKSVIDNQFAKLKKLYFDSISSDTLLSFNLYSGLSKIMSFDDSENFQIVGDKIIKTVLCTPGNSPTNEVLNLMDNIALLRVLLLHGGLNFAVNNFEIQMNGSPNSFEKCKKYLPVNTIDLMSL